MSLKAKCEILTSSLDKQCDEIKGLEKEKNEAKKQVSTYILRTLCLSSSILAHFPVIHLDLSEQMSNTQLTQIVKMTLLSKCT